MASNDWNRTDLTIHIVANAQTFCGIPTFEMKDSHRWVHERDDHHVVNCKGCSSKKEQIAERRLGRR